MTNILLKINGRNKRKLKKAFLKLFRKTLKDYQDTGVKDIPNIVKKTMELFIINLCDSAIENTKNQFESEKDLLSAKELLTNYLNELLRKKLTSSSILGKLNDC